MLVASTMSIVVVPYVTADTVHCTEVYGRPPFPYEPVASRARLAQEPKDRGQLRIIVGAEGLLGGYKMTD